MFRAVVSGVTFAHVVKGKAVGQHVHYELEQLEGGDQHVDHAGHRHPGGGSKMFLDRCDAHFMALRAK